MKHTVSFGLAGLLLASSVHALNPVQGGYIGLMGTGSQHQSSNFSILNPFFNQSGSFQLLNTTACPNTSPTCQARITYNFGGGGGIVMGYRHDRYRVEVQPWFNTNAVKRLTINGVQPISNSKNSQGFSLSGRINTFGAFVNGYVDFINTFAHDSSFVPFAGLGIGYLEFQNKANLNFNGEKLVGGTLNSSDMAAQGIIGFSYFLDDLTTAGFDIRYIMSRSNDKLGDRISMPTINFNLNFAFETFA